MAKIKEQFKNKTSGSITCVIRTDTYGSSLEFFIDLYNVVGSGLPINFTENAFSEASVTMALFRDTVRDGIYSYKTVQASN